MKKSTLIIILVIYIASIAIINFFGMSVKVYDEMINVESITCTNTDEEGVTIGEASAGTKMIIVDFVAPSFEVGEDGEPVKQENGEIKTNSEGTMLYLMHDIKPDNATKQEVEYIYNTNNKNIHFYKDETGRETGLVLFSAPTMIYCTIAATDGNGKQTTVLIWAKQVQNNN